MVIPKSKPAARRSPSRQHRTPDSFRVLDSPTAWISHDVAHDPARSAPPQAIESPCVRTFRRHRRGAGREQAVPGLIDARARRVDRASRGKPQPGVFPLAPPGRAGCTGIFEARHAGHPDAPGENAPAARPPGPAPLARPPGTPRRVRFSPVRTSGTRLRYRRPLPGGRSHGGSPARRPKPGRHFVPGDACGALAVDAV